VVAHSRELLAKVIEGLVPRAAEVGQLLQAAGAGDATVGSCPKCGKDLRVRSSRGGKFVGCSGWPDCDVTYPLPDGKIETVPEPCAVCGGPQVKVIRARSKPLVMCLDPACGSRREPQLSLGVCKACAEAGRGGDLTVRRSPKSLKRYVRCTNYDLCQTSYPLPQNGELAATGATCGTCGTPEVEVTTAKGMRRICIDPGCSSNARAAK
jgi:DNA topoisomerase-1